MNYGISNKCSDSRLFIFFILLLTLTCKKRNTHLVFHHMTIIHNQGNFLGDLGTEYDFSAISSIQSKMPCRCECLVSTLNGLCFALDRIEGLPIYHCKNVSYSKYAMFKLIHIHGMGFNVLCLIIFLKLSRLFNIATAYSWH